MRMKLKEGLAFEDVKIPGFVVQRCKWGGLVAYPKPPRRRGKGAARDRDGLMVRAAGLWRRLDAAGAAAWADYAVELHRRSGGGGAPMSGYNAFVKALAPVLAQGDGAAPSLAPPALPVSKRTPRKARRTPTPALFQGEGI